MSAAIDARNLLAKCDALADELDDLKAEVVKLVKQVENKDIECTGLRQSLLDQKVEITKRDFKITALKSQAKSCSEGYKPSTGAVSGSVLSFTSNGLTKGDIRQWANEPDTSLQHVSPCNQDYTTMIKERSIEETRKINDSFGRAIRNLSDAAYANLINGSGQYISPSKPKLTAINQSKASTATRTTFNPQSRPFVPLQQSTETATPGPIEAPKDSKDKDSESSDEPWIPPIDDKTSTSENRTCKSLSTLPPHLRHPSQKTIRDEASGPSADTQTKEPICRVREPALIAPSNPIKAPEQNLKAPTLTTPTCTASLLFNNSTSVSGPSVSKAPNRTAPHLRHKTLSKTSGDSENPLTTCHLDTLEGYGHVSTSSTGNCATVTDATFNAFFNQTFPTRVPAPSTPVIDSQDLSSFSGIQAAAIQEFSSPNSPGDLIDLMSNTSPLPKKAYETANDPVAFLIAASSAIVSFESKLNASKSISIDSDPVLTKPKTSNEPPRILTDITNQPQPSSTIARMGSARTSQYTKALHRMPQNMNLRRDTDVEHLVICPNSRGFWYELSLDWVAVARDGGGEVYVL